MAALTIRPGEGRTVAILMALGCLMSVGTALGSVGADTLLFARAGVRQLPVLYLLLGAVTMAISFIVTGLLGRMSSRRLYLALPLILAVAQVLAERAVVTLGNHSFYPALYPAIWLLMQVTSTLQVLVTWGLASMVFDTRQAKRLFPLIGAGAIFGFFVGFMLTPLIIRAVRPEALLLCSAAALAAGSACGHALSAVQEAGRAELLLRRKPSPMLEQLQRGGSYVRRTPLLGWMSLTVGLFMFLNFSLGYLFARSVRAQFPGESELASVIGLLRGGITGVALASSIFLANRLVARFGLMTMIVGYALINLSAFAAIAAAGGAFAIIALSRFAQAAWDLGLYGPAYQAMFNVVPAERRNETRSFMSGVPSQAGMALAGVMLLFNQRAPDPRRSYVVGVVAAVVCVYAARQARKVYASALSAALQAGHPQAFWNDNGAGDRRVLDPDSAAVAVAGTRDPDPELRRLSIEILGGSSAPEPRAAILAALSDTNAEVRIAALGALPSGDSQGLPFIRPLLSDPEVAVRARAAAAILAVAADAAAEALLLSIAGSADPETRIVAFVAAGEVRYLPAFEAVGQGLHAPQPSVRRSAVVAIAAISPERAVPMLVEGLADRARSVRAAAAHALGTIGAPALAPVLFALTDPAYEAGALLALAELSLDGATERVRSFATQHAEFAGRYHELSSQASERGDESAALAAHALTGRARAEAFSALRAMGLLGGREAVEVALRCLAQPGTSDRANAIELLEASGDPRIVRPLLPIFEAPVAKSPAAPPLLAGRVDGVGRPRRAAAPWVGAALDDRDAWVRTCAAHAAADLAEDQDLVSKLQVLAESDPDPCVRETAATTLQSVAKGNPMPRASMLSLVEKVIFLRKVPLFADLEPADLKYIGSVASERFFPHGEALARQGEPGEELFLIVSGEVQILVATPGEPPTEVARDTHGACVGEMALITQAPRTATLIAYGDVRALSLDQRQFESILAERPSTSLAVMRVLCTRLAESHRARLAVLAAHQDSSASRAPAALRSAVAKPSVKKA